MTLEEVIEYLQGSEDLATEKRATDPEVGVHMGYGLLLGRIDVAIAMLKVAKREAKRETPTS